MVPRRQPLCNQSLRPIQKYKLHRACRESRSPDVTRYFSFNAEQARIPFFPASNQLRISLFSVSSQGSLSSSFRGCPAAIFALFAAG